MRIAFFVSGILFIYVMYRIPSQAAPSLTPTVQWAITLMSLVCVALGFLAPRFMARLMPTQDASGPNPFQKQFSATVLGLAFFEASVLFGFVLHFLGADVLFIRIAVSAGIVSQLVWSPPRLPAAENEDTLGPR